MILHEDRSQRHGNISFYEFRLSIFERELTNFENRKINIFCYLVWVQ
jgi:hypothetical protein